MNTPQVIYIGKTIWSEEKINDSPAYFNEEAVRDLLRDEYEQANNIIRFASRCESPVDEDLIGVEQSIESAIKRLKGGNQ